MTAECPISCGECCDCWYEVEELAALAGVECGVYTPGRDCPHLGFTGCRLPRERRPPDCLVYLCERGDQALSDTGGGKKI